MKKLLGVLLALALVFGSAAPADAIEYDCWRWHNDGTYRSYGWGWSVEYNGSLLVLSDTSAGRGGCYYPVYGYHVASALIVQRWDARNDRWVTVEKEVNESSIGFITATAIVPVRFGLYRIMTAHGFSVNGNMNWSLPHIEYRTVTS